MRFRLLTLLLILPLLMSALTLEEAVERARQHNRALQKARENIAAIDAEYRNVRGSLFPQISFAGSYQLSKTWLPDSAVPVLPSVTDMLYNSDDLAQPHGLNDTLLMSNDQAIAGFLDDALGGLTPASEQEEASLAAQLKLDQVVFMGGRLINGLRVVAKVKTLTRRSYFVLEQQVVFETTDLFYAALLTRRVVDIQREALDTAQRHYDLVQQMFAQGVVSEYDRLRAELEVAKMRPELTDVENNYRLVMERLRDQIGWEEGELTLEGEIAMPAVEHLALEAAIAEGLANRTELELASVQVDINEVLYHTERGNYLPNIAISAMYSKFTASSDFSIEADDFGDMWQVGIGFQMPLFTGMSNTAKRAGARHELNKSRLDLRELQEMIELDVRNSWQQLQHDLENVATQENNIALAQKGLTIAEARFENNVGIQLEVLDAQMLYKSTRLQYLQSVYRAIMSWEALQKSLGRTL
ncbi:MAG: TolC family protein [Candidatus Cloacimonetes bacterium]|nr:TolC family protein [Candidatus Cloacimonadota bacterium]